MATREAENKKKQAEREARRRRGRADSIIGTKEVQQKLRYEAAKIVEFMGDHYENEVAQLKDENRQRVQGQDRRGPYFKKVARRQSTGTISSADAPDLVQTLRTYYGGAEERKKEKREKKGKGEEKGAKKGGVSQEEEQGSSNVIARDEVVGDKDSKALFQTDLLAAPEKARKIGLAERLGTEAKAKFKVKFEDETLLRLEGLRFDHDVRRHAEQLYQLIDVDGKGKATVHEFRYRKNLMVVWACVRLACSPLCS
jgi:hypothetical protein